MDRMKPKYLIYILVAVSILMLAVIWNVVFGSHLTEEEMIANMNTSENVQLLSKTLDNPQLLFSSPYSRVFLIYQTQVQKKSEFAVKIENGTTYRFIKYKGLFDCSDKYNNYNRINCSNLTTIVLERQKVRLFYYASSVAKRTVLGNEQLRSEQEKK